MITSPRNIIILKQSTLPSCYAQATERAVQEILNYAPQQRRYQLLTNVAANDLADMWVALSNSRTMETSRHIRFKQIETTILSRALDYMAHRSKSPIDPILLLNEKGEGFRQKMHKKSFNSDH